MKINEFLKDSLDICRKHPMLVIPMLASVVVVALLSLMIAGSAIPYVGALEGSMTGGGLTSPQGPAGTGTALGGLLVLSILSALVTLLAHSMTLAMAHDALEGRPVTLKSSWAVTLERIVPLVVAVVLVGLLVSIGMAFLVLPGLIIAFFLMFTFAVIVVDGQDALQAIMTSVRLVTANFGSVFVLFLVMLALGVLFWLVNVIVGLIPIAGPLGAIVVSSAFSAYLSVFLLQAYRSIRELPQGPDAET